MSLGGTLMGHNLVYAPWVLWPYRGLSDSTSFLVIHTLKFWDFLRKQALSPSPLLPLGGFCWLPPGESLSFFRSWTMDGDTSCLNFFSRQENAPFLGNIEKHMVGSHWMPGDTSNYFTLVLPTWEILKQGTLLPALNPYVLNSSQTEDCYLFLINFWINMTLSQVLDILGNGRQSWSGFVLCISTPPPFF